MKPTKIIGLLFLVYTSWGFAQSLYNPCTTGAINLQTEKGRFKVKIKKSNYGISFERNNPCLTKALKDKITKLALQPFNNQLNWNQNNEAEIEIIWKTNEKYYLFLPNKTPSQKEL